MANTFIGTRMPKPITLDIVPKPFGSAQYLWIAAWKGQEVSGPFGTGADQRAAINDLVDVTEAMLAEEIAA